MYDKFFHDPHHHGKEVHHRTLGIADESFELEMHEEHKASVSFCSATKSSRKVVALRHRSNEAQWFCLIKLAPSVV